MKTELKKILELREYLKNIEIKYKLISYDEEFKDDWSDWLSNPTGKYLDFGYELAL